MPQPSIKIPRNGGPLICFKHSALIAAVMARKKELAHLKVGRLWWNEHTGYEVGAWDVPQPEDTIHPQFLITNQTQSFYRTVLVVLRSCLRDGKRMEKALKAKNARIEKLEKEIKELRSIQKRTKPIYDQDVKTISKYEELVESENQLFSKRASRFIAIAKRILSLSEYLEFETLFTDVQTHGWEITKKKPSKDPSPDYDFAIIYVNQYVDGGVSGDEFAGEVWVEISPRHFIHFHYRM